jgi:hypothetical protein
MYSYISLVQKFKTTVCINEDLECNEDLEYNLYSLNDPIMIKIHTLWKNEVYYIVEPDHPDDCNNICIVGIIYEEVTDNLICINQNGSSCNFFINDDEMEKLYILYKMYNKK